MRTASARADRRTVLLIALSRERFVVAAAVWTHPPGPNQFVDSLDFDRLLARELQELFADGRAGEAVGLTVALARDVRNGEVE